MTNYRTGSHVAFSSSARALIVLSMIVGSLCGANSQASTGTATPAPVHGSAVRVYGNSVIPGGVHGSSELTTVLGRDQIVKAHYADFDAANAYVVQSKTSRLVHVSYRIGNEIYWTKNKVRLAKGEALLTDGKSFIRARCGNRIAELPQSRVSNSEPAPAMLDTVLDTPRAAVSLAGNAPGGAWQAPAAVYSSNNARAFAASGGAGMASPLQGAAPVGTTEARRVVAARAAPAAIAAIAPALTEAIDREALAAPVTTLPALLTPSELSPPLGDLLAIPVTLVIPTTLLPSTVAFKTTESILASLPSTLVNLALPPAVLLADDEAVELPEPGSLALLALALILFAVFRPRAQRK